MHLNNWYKNTKHPFILLLDSDMKFPPHTLERLRSWKLPYVSGAYMRRRHNPIAPVWFDYSPPGVMPMKPFTAVFFKDQLYKIGASGWGCILMHRDVVTAVRPLLKGEPEIIEDDMDLYPYDLKRIMAAIKGLRQSVEYQRGLEEFHVQIDEITPHIEALEQEIQPLRGLKDTVGSDIRFPFFARLAGFDLHLDTGVMCDHMLNYPISPTDFLGVNLSYVSDLTLAMLKDNQTEAERIQKAVAEL
jgi:hypothetical protein